MSKKLTRRELKTLKNALGKQGLTMAHHEEAQQSTKPCEVLQIDCFSMETASVQGVECDGWYVGYGVEYNGVGVSVAGLPESSASSESDDLSAENAENREAENESSGFSSDPPTDNEDVAHINENLPNRRASDDVSDKGQLLYGLDEDFYVDKQLTPINTTYYDEKGGMKCFKTGNLVTTNRFEVPEPSETDDVIMQGYQIIGDGNVPCVPSHTEDSESDVADSEDIDNTTTSSGLWCNFIIAPDDLDVDKKHEIQEERVKTIPLDSEKLAQISAAMANFKLPTPPGWEDINDKKILEFIKERI